jgi:hypothetical protein
MEEQELNDYLEQELALAEEISLGLKIPTIIFHISGDLNWGFKEFCPSEEKEEKKLEVQEIPSKKTKKKDQTKF